MIAVLVWAAVTPQGTRWLLESAIPLSGITFSAKRIEGKVIGHLRLTEVRVGLAQKKVELDTLELRWKPLLLLAGTIAVQELTVNGVRIQDDAPPDNKPPVLAWPAIPRIAHLFDGTISRFRVTNLSYRRLKEQPVLVTQINASVSWQEDLFSVTDLKALSPSGLINGTVSAGFDHPSLAADLVITPTHPIEEMDKLSLQVRQSHGKDPEPLVGTITISGSAGSRKLVELSGDVGMAKNTINLRRLRLIRPGQKGLITADGAFVFTQPEPVLSLQVKAAGLDLAPELNVPTDLSGTLRFVGTLNSYRGSFTLANQARGWRAATVSTAYHGTRNGVTLDPMTATILDGSLAGNLDIDWRNGFAIRGGISGKNLNPARIDPRWKGVANFNATGELARPDNGTISGSVTGVLLESTLHGQTLTGLLQADFAGDNLSLNRLTLRGKGFDLHASGELNRRLIIAAQISDFSRLVPGSEGSLQSEGWVRRRDGHLSGAIVGTGNKLVYAGAHISSAKLNARLDEGTGYPLHVAASLRNLLYDGYTLDTVTVTAYGTLPHHTLDTTLRSTNAEARLILSAGYSAGVWKGEISRLSGKDSTGPWNLTAPATFAVSAGRFSCPPWSSQPADQNVSKSPQIWTLIR